MCGIIAAFNQGQNKKPVNETIQNILENQIHRGQEGFGIIMINEDLSYKIYRSCTLALCHIKLELNPTNMAILHHRNPTSTNNTINQTHPIVIDSDTLIYKYLIIHNGIVANAKTLKKNHEDELGFIYKTSEEYETITPGVTTTEFNDSEALAIEAARFIENQSQSMNIGGNMAFVAVQIDKTTDKINEIFFARKGNPINMSLSRGKLKLSSEGQGEESKENILYQINIKDILKPKFNNFSITQKPLLITTPQLTTHQQWIPQQTTNPYSSTYQPPIHTKRKSTHYERTLMTADELREEQQEDFIEETIDVIRETIQEMIADIELSASPDEVNIQEYSASIENELYKIKQAAIKDMYKEASMSAY